MVEFITLIIYISIYLGLIALTFYALSFISDTKKKKILFTDSELPKVSVIIAAYNEEGSIGHTLDSMLKTDYPKDLLEILVVNDGSKDRTLEIAKSFEHRGVKVFSKKNGGKGTALNLGIKKCTGEIVFTVDADTYADPGSLKKMVRYFKNPYVMSVTPAISTYKVRTIIQRIQNVEYLLGLFLRKAFASLNAVHITPGAFSAYRKKFFDEHGSYQEGNITEDLEMALRIQYYGYKIENCPDAPVYTISPDNFISLMKQRRRWYYGLMVNIWSKKYRKLFSSYYGDLGIFVLPIAWISIIFAVFVTIYLFFNLISNIFDELVFLYSIGFDIPNVFQFHHLFYERLFFNIFSNASIIFLLFFMAVAVLYLVYATKKIKPHSNLLVNVPIFFVSFSVLFAFWWIVSLLYFLTGKSVVWK